jgi:tRNA1Val (adenine37-N6)-methyltransferase
MSNSFFRFKQFTIHQERCGMKVGTDGVLLGAWVNIQDSKRILDVGTGTGIIALMLAQRIMAKVDAIEIEQESYLQAVENVAQSQWNDRIAVINTSLQQFSINTETKYDLVICNPPFFNDSLKAKEDKRNYARHSDSLSSDELISSCLSILKPKSRLAIIMPFAEGSVFIVEATKKGLFCTRKTNVKSIPNTPIIRLLMEFSQVPEPTKEDYLVIGTGEHEQYSEKYKELTKDFYINF